MSLKVYYLDDEEALCEIFVECFSSDRVQVMAYSNPQTAIAAIEKAPPDIFFVDYRLPGTTGDEVAKLIASEIPKYLITGDISVKTEYKFDGVFNKPFKSRDIRRVIDEHPKSKIS